MYKSIFSLLWLVVRMMYFFPEYDYSFSICWFEG
jgi:hypothetical protein